MEKIKAILNPGAKADDDILYGQGSPDNTGKVGGEGSHFGHSRTTAEGGSTATNTTGLGSTADPGVANTASGFDKDINDASSTTATKGGIPGTTQPATHTENPSAASTASEGTYGSSAATPRDRHEDVKALASSRGEKGPQDTLQPDQHSSSALTEESRDLGAIGTAATTGSSIDNRQGLGTTSDIGHVTGSDSQPQDITSASNPYSSSPLDPRVDSSRSSAGKDHHVARDAALGGTAAGAGYAAKKHHDDKTYDGSTAMADSQGVGSNPLSTTDTTGASTGSYGTGNISSNVGQTSGTYTGYNQSSTSPPVAGSYGTGTDSSVIGTTGAPTGHHEPTTSVPAGHSSAATGGNIPSGTEDGVHIDRFPDSQGNIGNIGGTGYHTGPVGTAVSSGTTQETKPEHSHHGRDAILGAGAVGAVGAVGAGYEAKEHHERTGVPETASESTYDSQRQTGGTGILGSDNVTQQQPAAHTRTTAPTTTGTDRQPESQHHYGRDATALGGTGAATGLAAHEYGAHKDHSAPVTQTQQQEYPTSHAAATGSSAPTSTRATAPTTTGTEQQPEGQHHYGRDVAILGGAGGATGLAAHEYDSHKDHESQQQYPTTTTTQSQQPAATSAQTDPQTKDHHYGKDAAVVAGAGTAAGAAAHEYDPKKEQKEDEKEIKKEQKEHEKEVRKEQKEHEKEMKREEKEHDKEVKKVEKEHEKEVKKAEKEHEKQVKHEQKEHDKAVKEHEKQLKQEQKEQEKDHKSGGILGFLHRDKKDKDTVDDEKHDSYEKELAGAGAAGVGGAALAEHEHNKHKAEPEQPLATQASDNVPGREAATTGTASTAAGGESLAGQGYSTHKTDEYPTTATTESVPQGSNERSFPLSSTAVPKESTLGHKETESAYPETTEGDSHKKDALAAGAVGAGGAAFAGHEYNKHQEQEALNVEAKDQGPGSLATSDNRLHGKEGGAPGATGLAPGEYDPHNYQQHAGDNVTHEPHTTQSQTTTDSDSKGEKKSHGLLGFLKKDKTDNDTKDDKATHHSHEKEAAGGVAGGAAIAEHEHQKHDDRNRLHKVRYSLVIKSYVN